MKKGKNTLLLIVLIILVVFVTGVSSMYIQDSIASSITAVTAIIGAIAIWYQLKKDHDISKADFIISLNNTFHGNKNIEKTYNSLKEFRDNQKKDFSPEEGRLMGDYIMYFEIMNYLVDEKIVTIDMVNKLFANKFFIFVNNPFVQKYQLKYTAINAPIFELYEKWHNHRVSEGECELYPKNALRLKMHDFFYKNGKEQIAFNKNKIVNYANV